jgi:hypothetical protein
MIRTDIEMRKTLVSTLQNSGHSSDEYKNIVKDVEELDRNNISRVIGFYEKYGVPENQSAGRMQADAMWLIVSHNEDVAVYRTLFPAFQKVWEKEYLEEASFASYLQNFHRLVNGSRLEIKNPYRTPDEIDALLKALKGELK